EGYVKSQEYEANVVVDGAKLAQGQPQKFKMAPGGTSVVRLVRDLDRPFTVHVTIGNETRSIALPPQEKNKVVRELRYSKNHVFRHPTDDYIDRQDMCVILNNDDNAILIPGAEAVVTPHSVISDGGTFDVGQPSKYDPGKVCRKGTAYAGKTGVNLGVCGYL